jgi:AsmA protein
MVIEDGRAVIASIPAYGQPSVYEHMNLSVRDFSFDSRFPFELSANLPGGGTVDISGHVGPLNRVDAATSPADVQISIKRLDPVAGGFLAHNGGLSFLADIEMRSASDGHILTTNGTMHVEGLKLRKGAEAAGLRLQWHPSTEGKHRADRRRHGKDRRRRDPCERQVSAWRY